MITSELIENYQKNIAPDGNKYWAYIMDEFVELRHFNPKNPNEIQQVKYFDGSVLAVNNNPITVEVIKTFSIKKSEFTFYDIDWVDEHCPERLI